VPAAITVHPRAGITLSQVVTAMRLWFDDEGIEPASVTPIALSSAKGIAFEVAFDGVEDARLFAREFG
jgi:hypothetical protein